MELSERKIKILQTIIRTYLETGEPVGSRTISKDTDLNLSSATIRNEMSDLEEMGYIIQPHTSAGRIPTDKAYRLYVDTMLDDKTSEVQNLKEQLEEKAVKIDVLLKQVAKYLASNTNYATMVSGPRYKTKKVKFIQITPVDERNILTVIVLDNNVVKNQMLKVEEHIDQELMVKLNFILNTTLNGLDVTEMNLAIIKNIKRNRQAAIQELLMQCWNLLAMHLWKKMTLRYIQVVLPIYLSIQNFQASPKQQNSLMHLRRKGLSITGLKQRIQEVAVKHMIYRYILAMKQKLTV